MLLKLQHEWDIGRRIDGGGFGDVYQARSPGQPDAVAKLVPKASGAERELLFVDLTDVRNVVPIIDSGETTDHWVLVMPRAERSLRQELENSKEPLSAGEVVLIMRDIAEALVDLAGKVVHRDLKPENILFFEHRWCLADFGISRYAEATTAPDTQKFAMSPPYASPERWRAQRANISTDVYSLGVIAFELLSHTLPFTGASSHELREQHLHDDPPDLPSVSTLLAALIKECLYKAPEARPSPANILHRLENFDEEKPSPGFARLQEANLAEVARIGENVRQVSEAQTQHERRSALHRAANEALQIISDTLHSKIVTAASAAQTTSGDGVGWSILLNQANLTLAPTETASENPWGSRGPPVIDVVAFASINLRIPADRTQYEGRSHSLWYCDAQEKDQFQWFETAFMVSPFIAKRGRQNPFAFDPGEDAAKALSPGMAEFQLAWPFTPLVAGDSDEFVDRWLNWFAEAAQGTLQYPSRMPEQSPEGSWRRS